MGVMMSFFTLLLLSTLHQGAWAVVNINGLKALTDHSSFQNRYIVEVESLSQSSFTLRSEQEIHKRFYEDSKIRDVDFDVHKEFDSPGLFVGVSLTLTVRGRDLWDMDMSVLIFVPP
ncbi:hypothetical protein PM082_000735 [Marasmius tenuissimus]|nr:hypothetical protein PM082_000735 [Marasmius tenuissimus]